MRTDEEDMIIRLPIEPVRIGRPVRNETKSRVEIARSFSFKLNMGNYESRDFFCSQKAECDAEDAEATSEKLYEFCKSQVLKAVREYRDRREP